MCLNKHRRLPSTLRSGPELLTGTRHQHTPQCASFPAWASRPPWPPPPSSAGGCSRPRPAATQVRPGHHGAPACLAALLCRGGRDLELLPEGLPAGQKMTRYSVCGESPGCGALQLYVLSGVTAVRCGGENSCQAAGGNSQKLCWENFCCFVVKCCWEGRREQEHW